MALMWNRTVDWDEGDWRQFAACRSTEPDLFFPIGTTGPAVDQGIVMDRQAAVGGEADVELHAVGPEGPGPGEGFQGVLPDPGGRIRAPPMGLDCSRCSHAAYSLQHLTRRRHICVKSHVEAAKLLATMDVSGYSSERTLNGR